MGPHMQACNMAVVELHSTWWHVTHADKPYSPAGAALWLQQALQCHDVMHSADSARCPTLVVHLLLVDEATFVSTQVYVAYTEGVNFKRALADLLGLDSDASIGSCLQRIRQLLDR